MKRIEVIDRETVLNKNFFDEFQNNIEEALNNVDGGGRRR